MYNNYTLQTPEQIIYEGTRPPSVFPIDLNIYTKIAAIEGSWCIQHTLLYIRHSPYCFYHVVASNLVYHHGIYKFNYKCQPFRFWTRGGGSWEWWSHPLNKALRPNCHCTANPLGKPHSSNLQSSHSDLLLSSVLRIATRQ